MHLAHVSIMGFVSRTCITHPALIFRWRRINRSPERCKRRNWVEWWPSVKSVVCTTDMSGALPEPTFLKHGDGRFSRRTSALLFTR
jgi:hypothetical protein